MTMTLPTAVNPHTTDWDVDARARGAFAGTGEAQFAVRNVKTEGNLPLTQGATGFENTQASSATGPLRGVYWEFLATGGYDVSLDTRVAVTNVQFNAPNRVQISDKANDGFVFRLGTGSGSPPTNYRTWQVMGNDTLAGSNRENPKVFVIDLNDTSQDATIGTFDNTDVQCYGFGTVRFNMSGTGTNWLYFQRIYVFTTTKGSSDIPYFTGTSDWDDLIDLVEGSDYTDKISDEWAKREGSVYSIACPIQFGDNSTATTFNDAGAIVFWPDTNSSSDPRVRVTDQAFRVYANLRDNVADSITLTGKYNAGNSNPPWDFDLDLACDIDIDGASFTNIGQFDLGSSVSGSAVFSSCKEIKINNTGVDIDGSDFSSPLGNHLLVLNV